MLIELKTKNFRKLRERTIDFTSGLNVLRGANEDGKSTLIEALTYALFGAKALREPLADVVTWGEEERTLKVELTFAIEGRTYTIKRSKSGAEMTAGDDSVTGQNEVTAAVGRLLGVPAGSINRLVLAGQGDIRGALDQGQKATSELIEQLADFHVIDRIIELIGDKLLTGSPDPFMTRIATLEPALAELEAALAEVPDTVQAEADLKQAQAAEATAEADLSAAEQKSAPLRDQIAALEAVLAEQKALVARQGALLDAVASARSQLDALLAQPAPKAPTDTDIAAARKAVEDEAAAIRLSKDRSAVEAYNKSLPADIVWEGDEASFADTLKKTRAAITTLQMEMQKQASDARLFASQKQAGQLCGICGLDTSTIPAVQLKNNELDQKILAANTAHDLAASELKLAKETLADLEQLERLQVAATNLCMRHEGKVKADETRVPWILKWVGPVLSDGPRVDYQTRLDRLEAAGRAAIAHAAKIDQQRSALAAAEKSAEAASAAVKNPKYAEAASKLAVVQAEYGEVNLAYGDALVRRNDAVRRAGELKQEIDLKRRAYDDAKQRVDDVRRRLQDARNDLDQVEFNNALLKRVRAARPVIANKLWTLVLSVVSKSFSQMRGEESLVTKDTDGFKVNGKSIAGLSGSTLDLLGLAIRLALVRAFIPHAPFLILDEPSAACDAARTESMMGFLLSAGFDQMLVVTHEDTSEQVATNLIQL